MDRTLATGLDELKLVGLSVDDMAALLWLSGSSRALARSPARASVRYLPLA
jgi:hypothetical protein